jgi:hypothetical protein
MLHTSKRFDHIESRLTSFEAEQQKQVNVPYHLAARETADTTNRQPSLDTRRVPSPLRTQTSPSRRDDHHSGAGGDLQEALSALTSKLTKFHQQRQHSIPSSTTQSHAPSYAETEDISSGATRSTAVESSDGWLASATAAATAAEVATSGQWTPTNCSSHDAPRHSPPPKAHSPALRMVQDALTFHPKCHVKDHRMQPPPAPPKLAVPHRADVASSASPVMISQPRTEVYVQRLPAGSHKSSDYYNISDDALLHVAIKPTPSKKIAPGSAPGTPHTHHSNHDEGAPPLRREDSRTVERWLSTVSSSDDGFRNDTFLVSRSTQ